MSITRQDIGLDQELPYIEASPLNIRVPLTVCAPASPCCGSGEEPEPIDPTGFDAAWRLRAYEGFGTGSARLVKRTTVAGQITIEDGAFVITLAYGDTFGFHGLHRHDLRVTDGITGWRPVMAGDFLIQHSQSVHEEVADTESGTDVPFEEGVYVCR